MSFDDGLSRFIGRLYEAVQDPAEWRDSIHEIVRRSDSRLVVATTFDLRRNDIADIQFHGREDSAVETGRREYIESVSLTDPVLKWIRQHPGAGACESAHVIPEAEYHRQEVVKWSRSRIGASHWSVFYCQPIEEFSFVLTFFSEGNDGRPTRRQLALQRLLYENLERALRLAARAPDFAADDSALIAIDAAGHALSLSRRAEELLSQQGELVISGGLLTARCAETARHLQQAIKAAIDSGSGDRGRSIRIAGDSAHSNLVLIVSPLPPLLNHLPLRGPAALVRIVEVDRGPSHLSEHSHIFDLSPREVEIASALLEGHSKESLAASLGLSRNTVRNHVQALFRKTGTNRQADLIRILDRLARQ